MALSRVLEHIKEVLLANGVSDESASKICMDLARTLGGERHYIAASDFTERNREIMAGFRGNNYGEVASRFGITERQVRRIVHRKP